MGLPLHTYLLYSICGTCMVALKGKLVIVYAHARPICPRHSDQHVNL